MGTASRHKTADLSQDHDESHLPHVGRFPSHIWTCQEQNLAPLTVEERVIGHKTLFLTHRLQNRMTAVGNGQDIAVIECGATVLPCHRDLCKGRQPIELTEYLSHLLDTMEVLSKLALEGFIQPTLQRERLLRGPQHMHLAVFQRWGNEAFGVYQGLFAEILSRYLGQVGLTDFKVVTKNFIKTDT